MYPYPVLKNIFSDWISDVAKHFFYGLVRVQQVDVNLGPGYKNLTLNRPFLPFKLDTLTTPVKTYSKMKSILILINGRVLKPDCP
jgi:hypothetical protein